MEPVEPSGIGNQAWPLRLEGLPDRPVALLWMAMRLGVGDGLIHQPGIQLVIALHSEPRREEAFAHQPNLILDLPLLPARRRGAGDRIDCEIVETGNESWRFKNRA
jgi:hypothetical protein